MSSKAAPQQHKQPSRKGKKAWRKNVDVTEVQDGLENLREEIRTGGPVAEKKDDELFALDTAGSKDIVKKYKLLKPLKVDEILAQRSAVEAVDSRKRPGAPLPNGIYESASKKRKGDWVAKKDVQRLKNSINAVSHLPSDLTAHDEANVVDIWSTDVVPAPHDNLEYVPKKKDKVAPKTIRTAPIAQTASGRAVSAVPTPIAGTSYNPDFDEWQSLVAKEGAKAVEDEKIRLEEERKEAERLARVEAAAREEAYAQIDDESAWEGFETDNDEMSKLRAKRPKRKNPAERNKAIRRKEAARQEKHEKRFGAREKSIAELELANLNREVGPEASGEPEQDQGEEYGEKIRRRKFGNAKVPEKNLELVLEDELQESLRLLKPEGNLLQDRFRNLLVNGKVESRKPIAQAKKKRVKYTEKWSHKDFQIQV